MLTLGSYTFQIAHAATGRVFVVAVEIQGDTPDAVLEGLDMPIPAEVIVALGLSGQLRISINEAA